MKTNVLLLATWLLIFPFLSKAQERTRYFDNPFTFLDAGGGGHLLTVLPGPHGKVQVYGLNLDRFKVYGEGRFSMYMAPMINLNYNVQGAFRLTENFGVHAGLGRDHYATPIRKEDSLNTSSTFRGINTIEFGVMWLGYADEIGFDFFVSIPVDVSTSDFPFFTVGCSVQFARPWYNRRNRTHVH